MSISEEMKRADAIIQWYKDHAPIALPANLQTEYREHKRFMEGNQVIEVGPPKWSDK